MTYTFFVQFNYANELPFEWLVWTEFSAAGRVELFTILILLKSILLLAQCQVELLGSVFWTCYLNIDGKEK